MTTPVGNDVSLHLGIDLGGTSVKLGLCTRDGHVQAQSVIPTDVAAGPDEAFTRIAAAARSLIGDASGPVTASTIGLPGEIDRERGLLVRANHLPGWINVPVIHRLANALGIVFRVENDANCAAWGELCAGVGRGACSLVCFTLGTGVGGGVIIDGNLWVGASGAAAALGHIAVDPNGPQCRCGQRGCVEQYASATAIAQRYGRGSARDAFDAAQRGDAHATSVVDWACDGLAAGVANVIHTLQPDVVVLAGGVAAAGDALLRRVRERVARRVRAAWLASVRIEQSLLGDDAGWIGAALLEPRRSRAYVIEAARSREPAGGRS